MDLTDLKKSVTEMSDEELLDLLREVRASRRVPTGRAKQSKTADVSGMVNMIGAIDGADLDELEKALEAMLAEAE